VTDAKQDPGTRRVESGIAEYLDQFESSPYREPPGRPFDPNVRGVSTVKGSWFQKKPTAS
jgi:hypothetical protein